MRAVQFTAADGFILHGSLYGAEHKHAIVLAPAMSVPRRYYDGFAQFAASEGFCVLVFDYRGFGESRKRDARMSDWGVLDLPAAIEFVRLLGAQPVALVAQSVGGQVAGLAHNLTSLDKIVFLASQSGYWRHWSPAWRKYGLFLIWLAMPVVSRVLGFFPARLFRLGSEDLPRQVGVDWSRFGRNPRYVLGFGGELDLSQYTAYRGPLMAWTFEGDNYAPTRAADALLREYSGATITGRHVSDKRVGHFGFFRRGNEELWRELLTWLNPDRDRPPSTEVASSPAGRAIP